MIVSRYFCNVAIAMERSDLEETFARFQACARGYLARREVSRAQDDFEAIVREIDGDLTHLQWRETIIPIPHFTDTASSFLRPISSSCVTKPELHTSACPQNQPSVVPLSVSPSLHPEKMEAERDGPRSQEQAFLSTACTPNEQGVRDGEQEVLVSTSNKTTIWSNMGLDVSYSHSEEGPQMYCLVRDVPRTAEALRHHRSTLAMELLWLQQAISSRKKYLAVKQRLNES